MFPDIEVKEAERCPLCKGGKKVYVTYHDGWRTVTAEIDGLEHHMAKASAGVMTVNVGLLETCPDCGGTGRG